MRAEMVCLNPNGFLVFLAVMFQRTENLSDSSAGSGMFFFGDNIAEFFPFGAETEDTLAPPADDAAFGPIEIDIPIVFFQSKETSVYISTNGLVSFRSPFSEYRVEPFSNSFSRFLDPIVAPAWADLNPSRSGSVFYRATSDPLILNRTINMISSINSNFSTFQPTIAFIATWANVPLFRDFGISFSFQVVLVSDGKASFAVYIYADIIDPSLRRHVTIGFNAGDRTRYADLTQDSLNTVNVFRIDGNCITSLMPGEICPLTSVEFTCAVDEHRATACVCDEGTTSPLCLDLFPFGGRNNDTLVPRAIDGFEGPIDLPIPFVFFQNMERLIYISTSGVISFGSSFQSFRLAQFSSARVPVIAPLFADYDFREAGNVFYRVSREENTLRRARQMIAESDEQFGEYSPSLCVVVTWSEATLFSRESDLSGAVVRVSFQAVLSTDGVRSFVTFIYGNVDAAVNITLQRKGVIGFDAGDLSRSAVLDDEMLDFLLDSASSFRIDGNCITSTTSDSLCGLNASSLECVENSFTPVSCLCQPGFTNSTNCRLSNFVRFGIGHGDQNGPSAIDASSQAIQVDVPIIFYNKPYTELYVSTNGFISLEREFTIDSFVVSNFPRVSGQLVPLIAPLWADFNFRDSGMIYYRVTNNTDILQDILERIKRSNPDYAGFRPQLAVIATWFQGALFGLSLRANFQAVLVTDGIISFALHIYEDLRGLVNNLNDLRAQYIIGFDEGTTRSAYNIETRFSSTSEIVYRIDGACIIQASNDRCGLDSLPLLCDGLFDLQGPMSLSCLCINADAQSATTNCLDFLKFDARAGDVTISTETESHPIRLSTPIMFYGVAEVSLQVHTDGYITFGGMPSLSSQSGPSTFRLSSATNPVIAPTSSVIGVNNRVSTPIAHYRVAEDEATLTIIDRMIEDFNSNLTNFQPVLAVIATWQIKDPPDVDIDSVAQSVTATDGNVSLAIFLYENAHFVGPDLVGFASGNGSYTPLRSPRSKDVYRIDGMCITSAAVGAVCDLNSVAVECDSLTAVKCRCRAGYKEQDRFTCTDIDECLEGLHDCDQLCFNTEGEFSCGCMEGFYLQTDNKTCRDIDECAVSSPCASDAECTNTPGSFLCSCETDFIGDGFNCTEFSSSSALNVVGVSVGVAAAVMMILIGLVIVLLLLICYHRRKQIIAISEGEEGGMHNLYVPHRFRKHIVQSSFKHNLPKSHIIPSANLKLGATLGQGEFGIVYKASLRSGFSDTISDTVAVKTLRGFVDRKLIHDLLKECAEMYKFDHPNVLTMLGVCLDGGPAPYIIMPFMANGSLLSYLKNHRDAFVVEPKSEKQDSEQEAVQKKLLDMCIQVAKGMEYLASKRVIHRDLAARNCMIDVNFIIKVADFGLSESIDISKDYFRQDQEVIVKLPIKWMAPESVTDGVFSEKSDVWSYGVTCWEIFSGGKTPYPGIHPADLPHQLEDGLRMEKPHNLACTESNYDLMIKCWDAHPELRPSFSEITVELSSNLEVMADYLDFSIPNSVSQLDTKL